MKLILASPKYDILAAFKSAFLPDKNIELHFGRFETVPLFDGVVSAGNSFGLMDGGIDLAIRQFFGDSIMYDVQKYIKKHYSGEQHVGNAFVIETGSQQHPYLIYSPTMRVPAKIVAIDNIYHATLAALMAISHFNQSGSHQIKRVVFPAMGAGCGQVPPHIVAKQMALAWHHFLYQPSELPPNTY